MDLKEQMAAYLIENQQRFYRLAYSYVRNQEAALDAVQNAVVKALEHYGEIRNGGYLKTWFYRVLVNECCTYLRKHKRELAYAPEALTQQMSEPQLDPQAGLDDALEVYEQIGKLPEQMKTVIFLRFYEDFTLAEIAEITGASLSTVKYRLYTALKTLKKNFAEVD